MVTVCKIKNKLISILEKHFNLYYEKCLQRRLKNDDFSIICSNCIGGIISNRLNKQFLSPTVNMWIRQDDFLKFVCNLKEYISKEIVFIESTYEYPVGKLDDITLYFNHSLNAKEAKKDWDRRKNRINYDNLFIIMYDRDGITKTDIRKLESVACKNKIVLSDKEYGNLDYVLAIKKSGRPYGEQYLDKDWLGRRTFEKKFDFVKWLNLE